MSTRIAKLSLVACLVAGIWLSVIAQEKRESSYAPVVTNEPFATTLARMKAAKKGVMDRQMALLNERYDLSKREAKDVKMTRGKPIPVGPATKLAERPHVGQAGRHDSRPDQGWRTLPGGIHAAAAREPPGRWNALP